MNSQVKEKFVLWVWALSGIVSVLALTAWGQGIQWHFSGLSVYQIFPIFGLLAFSLIWAMYVVGFFRGHLQINSVVLKNYYKIMPLIIFGLILIHPLLLSWQLWRDDLGLPPSSYLQHYVAPSLKWAALVGTTAWLIFLVYELRFKFRQQQWWKYIEVLADIAFVGLFLHALALGNQIKHGWFRYVWFFYGIVLLIVLVDLYALKFRNLKN